jgi:cyclophilin family peptidyl-prolyl cis-trans isomerase
MYGSGDPGYTIPAEILPQYIHKKGALAAARTGDQINPERRSSGSQFYIVNGKVQTDQELTAAENNISAQHIQAIGLKMIKDKEAALKAAGKTVDLQQIYNDVNIKLKSMWEKGEGKFSYTPEQKEIYKTIGGAPHLDGAYSVFGEVVDGMDVVEKINLTETVSGDRPKKDIFVKKVSVVN